MKFRIVLTISCIIILLCFQIYSQTLELKFTAVNNTTWIPADSIKIINQNRQCDTMLYYPDTVLNLNYVDIEEKPVSFSNFEILNLTPNPVLINTNLQVSTKEKSKIVIQISNVHGKVLVNKKLLLENGVHNFNVKPGADRFYIITLISLTSTESIKLISSNSNQNKHVSLSYEGKMNNTVVIKSNHLSEGFMYEYGDTLMIISYSESLESASLISPESSQLLSFQFATNIPCPGIPSITYEGQIYNTIQIFNQCWLKENLNVGTMIPSSQGMSNDGIIEKYCYNDSEDSCHIYGGLYQWDEMMQYYTYPGNQGICMSGWHIPTNEEWKILEGAVDSQYGPGNPEWGIIAWRGFDAGKNLKSTSGWFEEGNGTDLYGFTALPSGVRDYYGYTTNLNKLALFWTSSGTNNINAWFRMLRYEYDGISNTDFLKERGHSVRCLKDN